MTKIHARLIPYPAVREGGDPGRRGETRRGRGRSRKTYRELYPEPPDPGEYVRRAIERGREMMRERGLE